MSTNALEFLEIKCSQQNCSHKLYCTYCDYEYYCLHFSQILLSFYTFYAPAIPHDNFNVKKHLVKHHMIALFSPRDFQLRYLTVWQEWLN